MVLVITQWLRDSLGWDVPSVFSYCSTRMVLAALFSLSLSIFAGPWFIRKLYEWRIGQPIRKEDCPVLAKLHEKKEDTPTMGGLLILCSLLASMLVWMDLTHSFTWILACTTVVMGSLGAYDDWLKLKYRSSAGLAGRKKLLIQVVLASLIALYLLVPNASDTLESLSGLKAPFAREALEVSGSTESTQDVSVLPSATYHGRLYLPFWKNPVLLLSGWWLVLPVLFTIFVVTGASNAVNLTDGLDGLAAGCVMMAAGALAVFAFVSNHMGTADYLHILYIDGSGEIAIFLCAILGSCLGFLWYNGHPAQVFMGDTGSLALGGAMGVVSVLLRREFLFGLVGGIFVVETLSVIVQVASYRWRKQRRVFLCAPLHHHFEYKGWPETKVVLRFWIIGLLLALLGVASLKFQ